MSQDAERIKRLVEFKKKLETRIEDTNSELQDLQATLDTVNSILLEKGFKHMEIGKEHAPTETSVSKEKRVIEAPEPSRLQPPTELESIAPLKAATGELLANLYLNDDSLRFVPAADKNFDFNTPPFTQFLVEKILVKMQERDSELVRAGQLAPERIFCYNIAREGDIIREITVKNADPERLRELRSSIRWTLEKMYEKMKSQA